MVTLKIYRGLSVLLLAVFLVLPVRIAQHPEVVSPIWIIPSFAGIFLAYRLYMHSKQLIAASFVFSPDSAGPVALYLRSFMSDKGMAASEFLSFLNAPVAMFFLRAQLRTREENMEHLLKAQGIHLFCSQDPVYKVAQPGAAKVVSAEWQKDIIRWMGASQLIIMHAAATKGTLWELEQIRRNSLWAKAIIILHDNETEYYKFTLHMQAVYDLELPEFSKASECVLVFSKEGDVFVVDHKRSLFSGLPYMVLALKRALRFHADGCRMERHSHVVRLGRLTVR